MNAHGGNATGCQAGALVQLPPNQQAALVAWPPRGREDFAVGDLSQQLQELAALLRARGAGLGVSLPPQGPGQGRGPGIAAAAAQSLRPVEAQALGEEAANLAAAVISFQERLAQAASVACGNAPGHSAPLPPVLQPPSGSLGPPPLPPPPGPAAAAPALAQAAWAPPLPTEDTQYAADSIQMGLLPDTAEVNKLVEQLDSLNGTIRVFDELLAAAGGGTLASLQLGCTLPKDAVFTMSLAQAVPRFGPYALGNKRPAAAAAAGAAAAAAAGATGAFTADRPGGGFAMPGAAMAQQCASVWSGPPQAASAGARPGALVVAKDEGVARAAAAGPWAPPADVGAARPLVAPQQPCPQSPQLQAQPQAPGAMHLLPPTYEGAVAGGAAAGAGAVAAEGSSALLPPSYEGGPPAKEEPPAPAGGDGGGAPRVADAQDTNGIASLLCSLEVAPDDSAETGLRPGQESVAKGEPGEQEFDGQQDSTVPGMPMVAPAEPGALPDIQRTTSLAAALAATAVAEPRGSMAPPPARAALHPAAVAAAAAEAPVLQAATEAPMLAPTAAEVPKEELPAGGAACFPPKPLAGGAGSVTMAKIPSRPVKRLGVRRAVPQVPVMLRQRGRSMTWRASNGIPGPHVPLESDAIETSQEPFKAAHAKTKKGVQDSCVAPGLAPEDSFPPTAPVPPVPVLQCAAVSAGTTSKEKEEGKEEEEEGVKLQLHDGEGAGHAVPLEAPPELFDEETQWQGDFPQGDGAAAVAAVVEAHDEATEPPRKRQKASAGKESMGVAEMDSSIATTVKRRSSRGSTRSRPDLGVAAASDNDVLHLGSHSAWHAIRDTPVDAAAAIAAQRPLRAAGAEATAEDGQACQAKGEPCEALQGLQYAASATVLAPQPADPNEAPLAVLFTGFARGDLHRFRRCVARLDGHTVRDLGDGAGGAVAAPGVRVVTRCVAVAAAASSTAITTQRTASKLSLSAAPAANSSGVAAPSSATRVAANRTMKYFHALLAGAWVVSSDWVLMSNSANRWLPEADFEVLGDTAGMRGPSRCRHPGPQLFKGLRLHFPGVSGEKVLPRGEGEAGPSPADLEGLARRGGAEVISDICPLPESDVDPPHLSADAQAQAARRGGSWWRRPIAILSNPSASSAQNQRPQRSSPHTKGGTDMVAAPEAATQARAAGWPVLPSSWMLDCISLGEVLSPPKGYLSAFPSSAQAASSATAAVAGAPAPRRSGRLSGSKPPIDVL